MPACHITTVMTVAVIVQIQTETECWYWQGPRHWIVLVLTSHHVTVLLHHSVVYASHHRVESASHTSVYGHHTTVSCLSLVYDHSEMKLHPHDHHYTIRNQSNLSHVSQTSGQCIVTAGYKLRRSVVVLLLDRYWTS